MRSVHAAGQTFLSGVQPFSRTGLSPRPPAVSVSRHLIYRVFPRDLELEFKSRLSALMPSPILPNLCRTLPQGRLLSGLLLATTAFSLAAAPTEIGGFSTERLRRLDAYADRLVADHKYSGLVVVVTRDGRPVYSKTAGTSNDAGRPIRTDDIFAIASLSKIVTSVAVLMLVEEGRVGLNNPVSDYLPGFASTPVAVTGPDGTVRLMPQARPITVRHLLTHTSGLVSFDPPAGLPKSETPTRTARSFTTLADAVEYLTHVPLRHQPGEAWTYGVSTDVLGRVIEVASGQPFETFLDQRIFRPLRMKDTAFEVPAAQHSRQVDRDERQPDGSQRRIPSPARMQPWPSGAGGLFSTPTDYIRFAHLLLNGGAIDGVRLLSPKTVELMRMDQLNGLAKPTKIYPVSDGFGLGVEIRTDVARSGWLGSQGTFGWNGATTAYCAIDPRERLVMMIWAQHTPNAEFGLYEQFNTLVYQAQVR